MALRVRLEAQVAGRAPARLIKFFCRRAAPFLPAIVGAAVLALGMAPVAKAQNDAESGLSDAALAEAYKPELHFYHDINTPARADFEPRTVQLLVDVPGTMLVTAAGSIYAPTIKKLAENPQAGNYLDLPGTPASPGQDYANAYLGQLAGNPDGYPITAYARVVRNAEASGKTVVQYWFSYYSNNWYNTHEGDWEMVEVILGADLAPESVAYSQHGNALTRSWSGPGLRKNGSHPKVYVARGSHANYFEPGAHYLGGARDPWGRADISGDASVAIPVLELDWAADAQGWMRYAGLWGQKGEPGWVQAESGPPGPAFQGLAWERPVSWAGPSGSSSALGDILGQLIGLMLLSQ